MAVQPPPGANFAVPGVANGLVAGDGFVGPPNANLGASPAYGPATFPYGSSLAAPVISGVAALTPTSIAAAGATQGAATVITSTIVYVTATASTEGVSLPAGVGNFIVLYAPGSVGVKVYPPKGGNAKINTHSTNAGVVLAAAHGAIFAEISATLWVAITGPNL
jgi:hypothetical protein